MIAKANGNCVLQGISAHKILYSIYTKQQELLSFFIYLCIARVFKD